MSRRVGRPVRPSLLAARRRKIRERFVHDCLETLRSFPAAFPEVVEDELVRDSLGGENRLPHVGDQSGVVARDMVQEEKKQTPESGMLAG